MQCAAYHSTHAMHANRSLQVQTQASLLGNCWVYKPKAVHEPMILAAMHYHLGQVHKLAQL
jgi:hypothetical protein